MSVFNRLENTKPTWVSSFVRFDQYIDIDCRAVRRSGTHTRVYKLSITLSNLGGPKIAEQASTRLLPKCCVERHINGDSSFCVSYGSTFPLDSDQAAEDWWNQLSVFLINQDYAHQHSHWPLRGGLSHGDAAQIQIKMEEIAKSLRWESEVLRAIFRREGWLSGRLPKRLKTKSVLVNSRAPCPRGCTWKHKLLRRNSCALKECSAECRKQHPPISRADCPNRQEVEALVLLEYGRRKEERDLVKGLANKGINCCGTMEHCGLRDILAQST